MTPAHASAVAALADVVEALDKSTGKLAKALLSDLTEDHPGPLALSRIYIHGSNRTDDGLTPAAFVQCAAQFGTTLEELKAGAEFCIVGGRYAVRTAAGLKLGPKVS